MAARETVTEADLMAFADGRLEEDAAARVSAWLEDQPDRLATIAAWRRQNDALHTLFDPVARETIPARLHPQRLAARASLDRRRWGAMMAGAMALVLVSLGAGWSGRALYDASTSPATALIDGAIAAHALYVKESRHAVEVPGDQKAHLDAWLSNRLGRTIDAPDLAANGFTLVGGRLLPPVPETKTGPAAQLMYQNAEAERLTVFVTASPPDTGTTRELVHTAGLEAYYWSNPRITCTVVGQLPGERLKQVASQIYHQLGWKV